MTSRTFSTSWKRSIQPRRQRRYTSQAPLHLQQKAVHVHLASPLRAKYGFRNVQIRKGDKIKVLRGQHRKKEGKVERVDIKRAAIYVAGIDAIKKDGSKLLVKLNPSNLAIVEVDFTDARRKQRLESKHQPKSAAKPSAPAVKSNPKIETKVETIKVKTT